MPLWSSESQCRTCLLLVLWLKLKIFQRLANEEQQKQMLPTFSWIVEFPWVCRSRTQISEIISSSSISFLLFPFSLNRRGGGTWQLLEYMFRICLLEQFSWSLDRNAFSLKDWNYELSERIWINMRWMLGLCLLLLCFVFLIRINQSSQNDWLVQEQELRVWGNASRPLLWFYPFDKI